MRILYTSSMVLILVLIGLFAHGNNDKDEPEDVFAAISGDKAQRVEIGHVPIHIVTVVAINPDTFDRVFTRRVEMSDFAGSKLQKRLHNAFYDGQLKETDSMGDYRWRLRLYDSENVLLSEIFFDHTGRRLLIDGTPYDSNGSVGRLFHEAFEGLL